MPESRQDRELIELLNELRVALPGVQVLFAFLLTIPFAQRFVQVTDPQKAAYFVSFLCTAASSIAFIAPSVMHRLKFRQHEKERLLQVSNYLAIVGSVFLAIGMTAVVFFITDFMFEGAVAVPVTIAAGAAFATVWYLLPLLMPTLKKER